MIAAVVAVREDSRSGAFIGFEVATEFLECRECRETYRLRYRRDYGEKLRELRLETQRAMAAEHPKHSDKIPLR
jgi:hypothetical protein